MPFKIFQARRATGLSKNDVPPTERKSIRPQEHANRGSNNQTTNDSWEMVSQDTTSKDAVASVSKRAESPMPRTSKRTDSLASTTDATTEERTESSAPSIKKPQKKDSLIPGAGVTELNEMLNAHDMLLKAYKLDEEKQVQAERLEALAERLWTERAHLENWRASNKAHFARVDKDCDETSEQAELSEKACERLGRVTLDKEEAWKSRAQKQPNFEAGMQLLRECENRLAAAMRSKKKSVARASKANTNNAGRMGDPIDTKGGEVSIAGSMPLSWLGKQIAAINAASKDPLKVKAEMQELARPIDATLKQQGSIIEVSLKGILEAVSKLTDE